jgi:hypothetical protein
MAVGVPCQGYRNGKLTSHFYRVPGLRMRGAIPLLPLHAFMAWAETSLLLYIRLTMGRFRICESNWTPGDVNVSCCCSQVPVSSFVCMKYKRLSIACSTALRFLDKLPVINRFCFQQFDLRHFEISGRENTCGYDRGTMIGAYG